MKEKKKRADIATKVWFYLKLEKDIMHKFLIGREDYCSIGKGS